MSNPSSGGWHPDPTGRHAQRYHDGTAWTDSVADEHGSQMTDPMDPSPASSGEYVPSGPGAGERYVPTGPGGAGRSAPAGPAPASYYQNSRSGPSVRPGPGLILAILGALVVLASLFVLPWASDATGVDEDDAKLSDVADAVDAGEEALGEDAFQVQTETYTSFGYIVGLIAVALGVAAALVRNPGLRIGAVVLLALVAVWHALAVVDLNSEPFSDFADLEYGAWAGVVGYALTLAGAAIGPARSRR